MTLDCLMQNYGPPSVCVHETFKLDTVELLYLSLLDAELHLNTDVPLIASRTLPGHSSYPLCVTIVSGVTVSL